MCVLASFSCRVYAEMQERKVRPVAGFLRGFTSTDYVMSLLARPLGFLSVRLLLDLG